jgi:hypothetical protein
MIWVVFLPVLLVGLLLLGIVARQVIQHLSVLAWQPVTAQLLERGVEESGTDGDWSNRRGFSRITGRYVYHWQGQRHESRDVALSTVYVRTRGMPDDWEQRLSGHLGEPGGSLTVWVNPATPDQAVAFRDLRWTAIAIELGFGLLMTLVGGLFLSGWDPRAKAPGFSWRVVAGAWVVGSLLGVLVPLLWRDGHPVAAVFAALPLLLAINGTVTGLRQRRAGPPAP